MEYLLAITIIMGICYFLGPIGFIAFLFGWLAFIIFSYWFDNRYFGGD